MALTFVFNDELSEPEEDPLALDVDVDIGIDIDVNCDIQRADIVTVTDTDTETATTLEKNTQRISIISKPTNTKIVNSKPKKCPVTCQVCFNIFPNRTNLMSHEAHRRSDAPIKCSFKSCPVLMCTSLDIKSHQKRCHESQSMTCSHCSKSFPSHSQFVKHSHICRARQKWKNKGFKFQCVPCGSIYRYELGLQLHQQEYHSKSGQDNNIAENSGKNDQDRDPKPEPEPVSAHNIDVLPSTSNIHLEKYPHPADFDEDRKPVRLGLLTHDPKKPTILDPDPDPADTITKVKSEWMQLEVDFSDADKTQSDQVKLEVV